MNYKQVEKLLNQYKSLMGLSDFKIILVPELKTLGKALAQADVDLFEKELTITLDIGFFGMDYRKQRNVLIHELTHSRLALLQKKIEIFSATEEEIFVNDLVRGLERVKD